MAPNSDESRKPNQATAKGATTPAATRTDARAATEATHKAGAITAIAKAGAAAIAAQPGVTTSNKTGSATASDPTKTGAATAPASKKAFTKSIDNTGGETDWAALRAAEAYKRPKVRSEQVTGTLALLNLFIRNQDESKPTIFRSCPRKNASQEVQKNDRTVPYRNKGSHL